MKNICLTAAFLLFFVSAYAQSFYVVTSTYQLKKVTINASGVAASIDINVCGGVSVGSIAIYKNKLYSTNGNQLSFGTISGNSIINCNQLSATTPIGDSLTADSTGVLYLNNGNAVCTFDPQSLKLTSRGLVPYNFAGDMIFYNGGLYMAATNGIAKIDLTDPTKSTLIIPSSLSIYGLAAVAYSSTKNKIYATAVNYAQASTDIIEVDIDNKKFLNKVATLPYIVFDAASDVESGEIPKIVIASVQTTAQCPYQGKFDVQVVCQNPLADYQYILNDNMTNTTGVFSGIAPGTYDLKVKSAVQTKDTTIIVTDQGFAKPVTTIMKNDENCDQTGQVSFNVSNGSLYTLQDASGTYPVSHVFTGLRAGNYTFYVLDQIGCRVDTLTVTINRIKCAINITGLNITKTCTDLQKGNVQVTSTPHTTATTTYTLDGVTNNTGTFAALAPGNYTLHIFTSEGIIKDTLITIPDFYLKRPVVTYIKTDLICEVPGSITVFAKLADSTYSIKSGILSYPSGHKFTGLAAANYPFTIIDKQGCLIDTLSVNINFIKCDPIIFPNTFTPNKDGVNDVFLPMQGGIASGFKFSVYDRFGALLFNSADLHTGWDGTYKGSAAPLGTYYWIATYYDQNNFYRTQSGSVLLVR